MERTSINGFSELSVPAPEHTILLVSDLSQQDLEPLAQAISIPLARRIGQGMIAGIPDRLATLGVRSASAPFAAIRVRPSL